MSRPQTIQIFLPGGDPQGMRIASVPTRTVQLFDVPRKLIPEFLKRAESGRMGVYVLSGTDDEGAPSAYIGQTSNLSGRLKNHLNSKDFWNRAFIAVSLTNEWTQAHIIHLEWHAIRLAQQAERMPLTNSQVGSHPHVPEPLRADCEEYLSTIRLLLSTMGMHVLEPVKRGDRSEKPESAETPEDQGLSVFMRGRGCNAEGVYSSEGLLVLAGAKGRFFGADEGPAYRATFAARVKALADAGVLEIRGDGTTVFLKDHLFATPSGAAVALVCSAANGRREWHDRQGNTIFKIESQELNDKEVA